MTHSSPRAAVLLAVGIAATALPGVAGTPGPDIDLATTPTDLGVLERAYGSTGSGAAGFPVAGGHDVDGDGFVDVAMASFQASPFGRTSAGEVYLIFGDGQIEGTLDSAGFDARILKIAGDVTRENAGSEIWMDDVTGDGLGDLLICRQNATPEAGREGAGILTIVVGDPALRTWAAGLTHLDLRSPPPSLVLSHLIGAAEGDRLGIWVRTGDVTGDGIADIVVGADQEDRPGAMHSGAVYVIRGGAHLAAGVVADLDDFGSSPLAGHLARIDPPASGLEYHFGATVQVADLDGNGRAEVLAAAALNRAGAGLPPEGGTGPTHASGGTEDGTLYIAWDDNFTDPWVPGLAFAIESSPGQRTILDGGVLNRSFGEEILGGLDYDGDGNADLFVGDLVAPAAGDRPLGGLGYVFYRAADLAGITADIDSLPMGIDPPTIVRGPETGAIAADTAMHGDFDGNGRDDLAIGSPHADPFGRNDAGAVHVLYGRTGRWPLDIDLAPGMQPPPSEVRIGEIFGANGAVGDSDRGDTLCYSGASGDIDGDGLIDLITNEMVGNGSSPGAIDVGNLIVVSGAQLAIFADGFESGDPSAWSTAVGGVEPNRQAPP